MTDKEAMKLALEALQTLMIERGSIYDKAITAIKERLAQPEQEPVMWPCLIDSADFSANTITLVMQRKDYKVSAGTHWLSPTPPQRTWAGLEGAEFGWFCHTDFLNARKYTKEQRQNICNQLLSEAQSWDIEQYILMMMRGVCD